MSMVTTEREKKTKTIKTKRKTEMVINNKLDDDSANRMKY